MATPSQTSSLIPTSIFTSDYSAPTNDPSNSGGAESISNLLASSGSPPLIVAFLAIGLFIVAVIAVFARRHIALWRRPLQPARVNIPPKPAPLGQRPVLWDAWSDMHVCSKLDLGPMRWEDAMPIAAVVRPPLPRVGPRIESVDPGGCASWWTSRCLVSAVKRFHSLTPPPPPPPLPPAAAAPPPRSVGGDKEVGPPAAWTLDEVDWADVSSLQVSVVIAMPNQRQRRRGAPGEDVDPEETTLREFCVGTADVPWGECE